VQSRVARNRFIGLSRKRLAGEVFENVQAADGSPEAISGQGCFRLTGIKRCDRLSASSVGHQPVTGSYYSGHRRDPNSGLEGPNP
jgi:hypothetical protein